MSMLLSHSIIAYCMLLRAGFDFVWLHFVRGNVLAGYFESATSLINVSIEHVLGATTSTCNHTPAEQQPKD